MVIKGFIDVFLELDEDNIQDDLAIHLAIEPVLLMKFEQALGCSGTTFGVRETDIRWVTF